MNINISLLFRIVMSTHKSSDYNLPEVKYYLPNSKNQLQPSQIFDFPEQSIMSCHDKNNNVVQKTNKNNNNNITEKIFSINYII